MEPTNFRSPDRWNSVPVPERVAERAYTRADRAEDGCWISRYSVASHGYSQVGWTDAGKTQMVLGHRAAWVHKNGQVPLGMTIDHLCKTRRCVNPSHMRLLPNYENARRINGLDWDMGSCANGHPNNLRVPTHAKDKRGKKREGSICSECLRTYHARSRWRKINPGIPFPADLVIESDSSPNARRYT